MTFPLHVEELLQKRYYLSGEAHKAYYGHDGMENWEQLCRRVSKTVSEHTKEMEEKYFQMIHDLEFLPNSPTLFGAGVPGLCLSACFIAPMEDSIEGWANTFRVAMKIQTAGGGVGFPLHELRPHGFPVTGKRAKAAGPIEFMKCWNQISLSFRQAVRNGANMGQLRIDHKDVEEFITCKDKDKELSAFNISVMITEEFMDCVKNDKMFDLKWKDKVVKQVRAKDLWEKIIDHAWLTGEPGIIFYDRFQASFPHIEPVYGNPCSEAILPKETACNLGSINLMRCVYDTDGHWYFNYGKFEKLIQNAYTFLDDLIDVNTYPTPEIDMKVKKYRQIGLGVMGLADVLLRMGMRYGSPESLKFTEKIMMFKETVECKMNLKLAEERGVYPGFTENRKGFASIPMRNANTSCVAPCGTISMIAGVSSGIEPVFSFEPITRIIDGQKRELFAPWKTGKKEIDVDFNMVNPEEHIAMLEVCQKYTNMSISKTINLPNSATREDVAKAYWKAYESGVKCVTVYRDGSRENQTIQTKDSYSQKKPEQIVVVSDKSEKFDHIAPVKRSGILSGKTFKDRIACGTIYTTINFDSDGNMIEVFVRPGKTGGCQSNVEAIARLLSISLRSGVKINEITKQLKGIRCPACMAQKDKLKFTSCADAIAKGMDYATKHKEDIFIIKEKVSEIEKAIVTQDMSILSFTKEEQDEITRRIVEADTKGYVKFIEEKVGVQSETCPDCGKPIVREAGCKTCKNCGWSKCG